MPLIMFKFVNFISDQENWTKEKHRSEDTTFWKYLAFSAVPAKKFKIDYLIIVIRKDMLDPVTIVWWHNGVCDSIAIVDFSDVMTADQAKQQPASTAFCQTGPQTEQQTPGTEKQETIEHAW